MSKESDRDPEQEIVGVEKRTRGILHAAAGSGNCHDMRKEERPCNIKGKRALYDTVCTCCAGRF